MAETLSPANSNPDPESPGPRTKGSITRLKRIRLTATRPTAWGLCQENVSWSKCTPLCHNKSTTIACKAAATSVLLKTERGERAERSGLNPTTRSIHLLLIASSILRCSTSNCSRYFSCGRKLFRAGDRRLLARV